MPQTYLPSSNFRVCAYVLDDRRLGNQRVDNIRVLESLSGYRLVHSSKWHDDMTGKIVTEPWAEGEWYVERHLTGFYKPVSLWRGHEWLFKQYNQAICLEYSEVRGFKDTCQLKFETLWNHCYSGTDDAMPDWFNVTAFHQYMQYLLVQKAPKIYRAKFPGLLEEYEYKWPTKS
jgi:hypothetical protein